MTLNWELLVKFIGEIIWPLVVILMVILFRNQIIGLLDRTREFEGPGSVKLKLDPKEIARIVEEGTNQNESAATVAERIIKESVVDTGELRILRALLGEDQGRSMNNYKAYYRPAMDSLLQHGYIRRESGKYFITDLGKKAAKEHLTPILATVE